MTNFPAGDDGIDRLLASEALRRALATLSHEHRSVIVEVYFRGRSASETAALLGVPEGTVKSRAYYALRNMRHALGGSRDLC
jgi:RNA polymerase sigma-70 factor (ECF subfamily)